MIIKTIIFILIISLLFINPNSPVKKNIINKYLSLCNKETICKNKIIQTINERFNNYNSKKIYMVCIIISLEVIINILSFNSYIIYVIYIVIFYFILHIQFTGIDYNTEYDTNKYTILCSNTNECKLAITANKYIKDEKGNILLLKSNKTNNKFNKDIEQLYKNYNINQRMYKLSVILIYYFLRYGILDQIK